MIRIENPLTRPGVDALPPGPHTFTEVWVSPQIKLFHHLWNELHGKQNPTQEWFDDWLKRIPNIGCDCKAWLLEYLTNNTPQFNDWRDWTWRLHNAVNIKLEKEQFSYEDFAEKWQKPI